MMQIEQGSHAAVEIDWGDGNVSPDSQYESYLSYPDNITFVHVYDRTGTFYPSASLSNFYNKVNVQVNNGIIVQNPVVSLELQFPSLISVPNGLSHVIINSPSNSDIPSNVTCHWELSEDINFEAYSESISTGIAHAEDITFTRNDVGTRHTINVTCYNLVSSIRMSEMCSIQEVISGVYVYVSSYFLTVDNFTDAFLIAEQGSHIQYRLSLGDTRTLMFSSNVLFAVDEKQTFQISYPNIGNYTIEVNASNLVSSVQVLAKSEIVVLNPILYLNISSNDSVLWPPGIVRYIITALSDQQHLSNVECVFEFGLNVHRTLYIDSMVGGDSLIFTHSFTRDFLGNTTANVTCNNKASNFTMSTTIWVILDEVILSSLTTNESVLFTNTSVFILDVKRFGSKSCFLFSMADDSTDMVYGCHSLCSSFADENMMTYVSIEYGTMQIIHEHIYPTYDHYNASVFAFNHVSNSTLYVDAWVKDWPCEWPNVTMNTNMSDENSPFQNMKSVYLEIIPYITINCMKTQQTTIVWQIYRYEDLVEPLFELFDNETYLYEPKSLDYGKYMFVINVTMFGLQDRWNISEAFIEIIKTPLVIEKNMFNSSHIIDYNTTYFINVISASFDIDVNDDDKTGMTFEWRCHQNDEEQDADISEKVLINEATESLNIHFTNWSGGCFGGGKGVLDVPIDQGILRLNSWYLYPERNITLTVKVMKDTREITATTHLFVRIASKPTVHIK